MSRAAWMSDPTLTKIPQQKMDFLCDMFDKVKGKDKKELMPFLMAMSGNAKKQVRFSYEEMQLIIAAIRRAASAEEQTQINKVLDMAAKKAGRTNETGKSFPGK